MASIPDHPNPELMAVAFTVTFQERELLPTISVTYVVIPGLPGPPFLLLFFSFFTLKHIKLKGLRHKLFDPVNDLLMLIAKTPAPPSVDAHMM